MHQRAVLAGGCFWGMQDLIRKQPGIVSTRVGYTGGDVPNATYRNHGTHAEGIEIIFDPAVTSYRNILEYFFQIHDPTTKNRQGHDIGTQYRSVIFAQSAAQRATAEALVRELSGARLWPAPIVTEIADAAPFWPAEGYHQDYFANNPAQPYCMAVVAPKVAKFRKQFLDRLKRPSPAA